MARKKLSYADHAWLRMDDPTNLMIITGLMTFDAPLDMERLKGLVETHLLGFRRFRQKVVYPRLPFRRPSWVDDRDFVLENHLHQVTLPEPGDDRALRELISLLMGIELDYNRPLWEMFVVENYGEGSALVCRLHHSIADGISLMQVLLSMTNSSPDSGEGTSSEAESGESQAKTVPLKTSQSAVLSNGPVEVDDLLDEGRRLLNDREHARMRAFQGLTFANALGRILARWPDPTTLYKGPLGEKKRAAWSDPPLSLNEVKEVRKAFDATVNDVLLSAAAGALGRYLEARKDSEAVSSIRGLIPVNLRPVELDEDLGNKFGLVFLSLPIGIRDPVKRLAKLKETMDGLKSSVEPAVSYVLLSLLGALPDRLEDLGTAFFDMKGTTVMTNVPGPQSQLYLAGAPINTIMAWVPQSGSISLGISLISYNGKVWLGVATDEGLVPDPETIVEFFRLEFEALKAEAAQVTIATRETVEPMLSKLDHSLEVLDRLLAGAEAQKEAKAAVKKKPPAKKKTTRKKPAEAEGPPQVEPEAQAEPGEVEGEAADEELAKSEEEVG